MVLKPMWIQKDPFYFNACSQSLQSFIETQRIKIPHTFYNLFLFIPIKANFSPLHKDWFISVNPLFVQQIGSENNSVILLRLIMAYVPLSYSLKRSYNVILFVFID